MNYLCENNCRIQRAIYAIRAIREESSTDVPFAYAGSCAMFLHGIPLNRLIHDVDIMVDDKFLYSTFTERLLASKHLTTKIGKYPDGMIIKVQHITCPTIRVDIMFVKDFYKKVEAVNHPLRYGLVATLDNLVEVKTKWDRPKDQKDIQCIALFRKMQAL